MALRPKSPTTSWGRAFEGALESAFAVVVGVVLGYYCDRWLGTEPVFLFVFLILGFVAGFSRLLQIQAPGQEDRGNGGDRGPDEPGG